jgi:hypothetical protein
MPSGLAKRAFKGVGPRFKTLATKKRPVVYQGKGKHPNTSKRPIDMKIFEKSQYASELSKVLSSL